MKRKPSTDIPANFGLSERVQNWAKLKGYDRLEEHLEYFLLKVESNGYRYASYDAALMTAIRDDWAKLRTKKPQGNGIVNLGKSLGIEPRPGEEMFEFHRRVVNARH